MSGAGPDGSHTMDIFLGEESLVEIVLVSNTFLIVDVGSLIDTSGSSCAIPYSGVLKVCSINGAKHDFG